jgi:uroporphyrinogen decarboxylase
MNSAKEGAREAHEQGRPFSEDFRRLPMAEMRAIVARFERRVAAAQESRPSNKEEVKKAVRRQGALNCPVWLNTLSYDAIVRYGDDLADLLCEYPDDLIFVEAYEQSIGYQGQRVDAPLHPVELLMQESQWSDEWGTQWGHALGGVGPHPMDFPIKDWAQLDEYLEKHFANPYAPGRMDAAAAIVNRFKPLRYCVGTLPFSIKARLFNLRGTENVLMDLSLNEAELRRLAEAVCEYSRAMVRNWAGLGVDAVFPMDDWGTQNALLISPAMWRSFFKPYYKAIFDEAHQAGLDVFYHSCGNIMEIIGDLIDIGVDVLHPLQPGPLDLREVARRFGGKVSFCGAIDVQRLLPSAEPSEIRKEIRRIIDTLGSPFGNSFIPAPANVLGPDIPFQNLRAMFEACHAR